MRPERARLHTAFRVIVILLLLALCEGIVIGWLVITRNDTPADRIGLKLMVRHQGARKQPEPSVNIVQRAFPGVDFTKIYPNLTPQQIDRLQRESFELRHIYTPFVQFRPLPVAKTFVEIMPAGFRRGRTDQPWPPEEQNFVVFVFGGSTTFGYSVPNGKTVVSALQDELSALYPEKRVECYNFGSGYYFSSQERILFESLLLRDIVPDLAIFIDGLNEFYLPDGLPELTREIHRHFSPDLPPIPRITLENSGQKAGAVDELLARYARNLRMVEALADAHGLSVMFVGQPVPFLRYHRDPDIYPFSDVFAGHNLCRWGYFKFEEWSDQGRFGRRFIWCGDAFSDTRTVMYVDSIHYSWEASRILARLIIERGRDNGLLP